MVTDGQEWFGKDKTGLGIPLANLPYIIDGDVKVSETDAVVTYIIEKYGDEDFKGKTAEDKARIAQWKSFLGDIATGFMEVCFCPKEAAEAKLSEKTEKVF